MRAHLLLLVLGLIVWARSIHSDTVNYDTPWLVVENPILSTGSPSAVPTILTDLSLGTRLTLGAEYLPVRDLSVLVDFALFGSSWAGHHTTNLLFYLLSCSLLLMLLEKLLPDERLAWLAAALYTVHPVHVESVSWLASRKDVVSLALFFGAILLWLRGGWRAGVLSVACFGLSYWAKNTAITLPAILVVLSLLHARQSPREVRWWAQWVPYGAVALAGLLLTMHIGGMVAMMSPVRADSAWGVFTIEAQVILHYLGLMVWPAGLSIQYPEPAVAGFSEPRFLLGLLSIVGLLAAAARFRRYPVASLGILWFFITLLPVSQIIPIQNLIADRYLLLPSAGLILAGVSFIPARWLRQPVGLAAAGAVILALSVTTWIRCGVWHSSAAMWGDLVDKHPTETRGWASLAGLAVERGDLDQAEAYAVEGLQHVPGDAPLLQSQGLISMERQDYDAAETHFRAALQADPDLRKSKYNLMLSMQRRGRLEEAIAIGEELVAEHPLYETAWNALGAVYIGQNDPQAALPALERAHALNPYNVQVLSNLGNVSYLLGDKAAAAQWWQEVLLLDPENDYARRGLEATRGQ